MITCLIRYELNPDKIREFERYGKAWISLVNRFGGRHHGYLMPSEGASDVAYESISFESMAAYEDYRTSSFKDPDCIAAFDFAKETACIRRFDRTFLRPVTEGMAL